MSDKTNVYVEFEGKNTEEAIAKASETLNISPENLNFTIVTMGSKGFLGFGFKNAVISVNTEKNINIDIKIEKEKKKIYKEEHAKVEKSLKNKTKPIDKNSNNNPTFTLKWNELPQPSTLPGKDEIFYVGPEDEVMLEARTVLTAIMKHLNIEASIEVKRIDKRIILNINSPDIALLIGKKGSTLEALQFLVNKIIARKLKQDSTDNEAFKSNRVIVDAENYKFRRHTTLLENTEKLANKVLKTGRPSTISNLNAQERRLIHLALQETPGLYTKSQGSGLVRNLVILPFKNK